MISGALIFSPTDWFEQFTVGLNLPVIMAKIVIVLLAVAVCGNAEELKVETLFKPEVCEKLSKNGDLLSMDYIGTLEDGTKFDSR